MSIECFSKRPDLSEKLKKLIAQGGDELQAAKNIIAQEFKLIQSKVQALKQKLNA